MEKYSVDVKRDEKDIYDILINIQTNKYKTAITSLISVHFSLYH